MQDYYGIFFYKCIGVEAFFIETFKVRSGETNAKEI